MKITQTQMESLSVIPQSSNKTSTLQEGDLRMDLGW